MRELHPFCSLHRKEEEHKAPKMIWVTSFVLFFLGDVSAFINGPPSSHTLISPSSLRMDSSVSDDNSSSNSGSDKSDDSPRGSPRRQQKVMSKAIPFLRCPAPLVDCDFAGNVGFDPLGLAKNRDQLWEYREAEMKHARLAMLAAVGWPASELWDRVIASQLAMDPMLDAEGRAPSLLNGGLARVSPIWWGFCIGLTAAIDLYGIAKSRRDDSSYRPGKLDFDPMGLYPADPRGQKKVEEAEIKNGRLAMLAVVSYCWEEWATKMAVVAETPWFFTPLGQSIEIIEQSVANEAPAIFAS